MTGFCGCLDFDTCEVDFAVLRRMCMSYGAGCAYIKNEFGIICDRFGDFSKERIQPVTFSYNNHLYTAAIVADCDDRELPRMAQGILEGYCEEGEDYINKVDFPYALALYDARYARLILSKGMVGDKGLYYSRIGNSVYFATSLRAVMRLFGGTVRVDRGSLVEYICADHRAMPQQLFCDIRALGTGQRLTLSRLGIADIPTVCGIYPSVPSVHCAGTCLPFSKKREASEILSFALWSFGYPQFDVYMIPIICALKDGGIMRGDSLCICSGLRELGSAYSTHVLQALGNTCGAQLSLDPIGKFTRPSASYLKAFERQLDGIIEEYKSRKNVGLCAILEQVMPHVQKQISIPMRIRRKGMLCQVAMWFDSFNIVFVN